MLFNYDNIEITLSPTFAQLNEIKEWLQDESISTNDGFYSNWNLIKIFFDKNYFATVSFQNQTIGFITWRLTSQLTANIYILEIKPEFRKSGFGKILVEKVLDLMIKEGVYAVDLQAKPTSSASFWKKLGFVEVPKNIRHWNFANEYFYKILAPKTQSSKCLNEDERIELWECEPNFINQKSPNKQWLIKLPIIHPVEQDWRISWIKGGKTLIDTKVKHFGNGESYFAPFLIIRVLPTIK